MNKKTLYATAAVTLALAATVLRPHPKTTLCEGFLPRNDMNIPVGDVRALGIKEDAFNRVMDKAQEVYAPVIAAKGAKLKINRLWSNGTVNASADQQGSDWILNMYGGLARHAATTEEGFALVVCHELGHHLGGFPKYSDDPWASNEGQSDYFATAKCLRKLFPDKETAGVDPVAAKGCEATFPKGTERNLCLQNALGGMSVAKLFQALTGSRTPPKFDTPDRSSVGSTQDGHPATQCRLDTYFQGSLCTKAATDDLSPTAPAPGACTAGQGYTQGLRPTCWYKPQAGEAPALLVRSAELPSVKSIDAKLETLKAALSGSGR